MEAEGKGRLTLGPRGAKVNGEVVNGGKEGFDVQDELFGHFHAIEIVPAADLPQHLRYARRAALLERAEDRPYPVNLLFDLSLAQPQRLGRLARLLVLVGGGRAVVAVG